jgi:hypothetical protein
MADEFEQFSADFFCRSQMERAIRFAASDDDSMPIRLVGKEVLKIAQR